MDIEYVEKVLQTYSIEDILEINDLTYADILLYLCTEQYLQLPEPEPL